MCNLDLDQRTPCKFRTEKPEVSMVRHVSTCFNMFPSVSTVIDEEICGFGEEDWHRHAFFIIFPGSTLQCTRCNEEETKVGLQMNEKKMCKSNWNKSILPVQPVPTCHCKVPFSWKSSYISLQRLLEVADWIRPRFKGSTGNNR